MPLKHSASDDARSANIAQLVKDGYPAKQAAAIAYSIQRKAKGESRVSFSKGQIAEMKLALGPKRMAEATNEPHWDHLKTHADKLAHELHSFHQAITSKSPKDAMLALGNMLAHTSYLAADLDHDLDTASHDVSTAANEVHKVLRKRP